MTGKGQKTYKQSFWSIIPVTIKVITHHGLFQQIQMMHGWKLIYCNLDLFTSSNPKELTDLMVSLQLQRAIYLELLEILPCTLHVHVSSRFLMQSLQPLQSGELAWFLLQYLCVVQETGSRLGERVIILHVLNYKQNPLWSNVVIYEDKCAEGSLISA